MFQAKLHIFINISVNSERIAFKPSQSGVNFSRRSQQGVTTLCFEQNYTFYSNPSNTCRSILSRLSPNLHKVGLIFQDDRNKGSQPYVPSKTAHFHQCLSSEWIAFKPSQSEVNFSRRSQQGVTTLCFEQNYTFYSNPSNTCRSILSRLSPNLHKVGLIFQDDRNKGSQPYVPSKTAHFHQYLSSEWIAFKPSQSEVNF